MSTDTDVDDQPARVRPFADILRDLGHGQVTDEAAIQLQDLVAAVATHRKKGVFTLTLEIAPMKGKSDALVVSARAIAKPPAGEPVSAVFFTDDDHNLVRDDPNQPKLPFRDASAPSTTARSAAQ